MNKLKSFLIWGVVVLAGLAAFTTLAIHRGEQVSAVWMVIAAVSVYAIAYRFYSLYIAKNVMQLDPNRLTPAERHNDGLDYVPTHKGVLFGHHFAAIAGAGPLVGPVLAAQMGYLPGTLWIIFGVVFAGAVQDAMVLFVSMRRDGKSLDDIVKQELGISVRAKSARFPSSALSCWCWRLCTVKTWPKAPLGISSTWKVCLSLGR